MSKENNLTDFLTGVADAIREKKGTTEKINPQNFADEIAAIKAGGEKKRVSYIQRNGMGYIDTGLAGSNSNLTIIVKYAMRNLPTGYYYIIRAYNAETANATRILWNKNVSIIGNLNSIANNSAVISVGRKTGFVYTDSLIPTSTSEFKLDTVEGYKSIKRTNGTALTDNIKIFNNNTSSDGISVDLYQCKIYDGSTLVRNFIPDYRDGEFGMYDTVSGQFFGNAGSGTFGGEIITLE